MIILTPLTEKDLPFLLEVRNNESTREHLINNSIFDLEQCIRWFNKNQPKWFVILNNEHQKVGYFKVDGKVVGCDIHPHFRRRGYARAAYKEYLKENKDVYLEVFSNHFIFNFYKEIGFEEIGSKIIRNKRCVKMKYKS